MEPTTLQAFLRVLYTVNNNPQYILAKSLSQVPAIACSENTAQSGKSEPTYARTPLKACLAAVCDSSPELLQDSARDFSLYVLDPLESQPLPTTLAQAPHTASSPQGVAVALGLMSWALESTDSSNVFVTGTIIPNASPALEVVFALRETKRMPKPIIYSYPSFGSMTAPGPSQPLSLPHPSQAAWTSWLSTSHSQREQQEQQTLARSTNFPEFYIGPPRRARGRPEGSASSKPRVTSQASTDSIAGASSSKVAETQSESKEEVKRKPKQKTKPKSSRAPPTQSPFISAPLTRRALAAAPEGGANGLSAFYQQSHPSSETQPQPYAQFYPQTQPHIQSTQNLLLELLSAIPSATSGNTNTTPEQQAALLSALQGLLATNPHLLHPPATTTGLSASRKETVTKEEEPARIDSNVDGEYDGDSDIVILDSSAIDTTAFRKPSIRQLAACDRDTSPLIANQALLMPTSQGTDSSPLPVSTPPFGQENTPVSSQTSTPSVSPGTETPTSRNISSGRTGRENATTSNVLDILATTTPSQTRKRKLTEYVQGQIHSSPPMSPPFPSPSARRSSSSGRALTVRQRVQSSPTGGAKLEPLPSQRLPSMLDSMRTTASLGSRTPVSSLGSSTHVQLASLTTNQNGRRSTTQNSGPSTSMSEHPGLRGTDAPSNGIALDTVPLKRKRTLNLTEFMEEREARRIRKPRKRLSSGRKLVGEASANASQVALPRSTNSLSILRHAQSSPSRPLFRSNSSLSAPMSRPGPVLGTPASNSASSTITSTCTASSTSTSTAVPAENPLKKFVLPAWARTSTAMLPRLSEEALARQHEEREAKKAQVSLRRREAAKAKRKCLRGAEGPSKESSDEDENAIANVETPRTLHPSSGDARSAPSPTSTVSSQPVFASDAVEPIPTSPPLSHRQLAPFVTPSTPPRKSVSSHRTPSKSGPCSLFTPSGQDLVSLFTPSTPSATQSLTRAMFTPRSPTVLHRSSPRKSPRKSMSQTPWTPMGNSGNHHQTPRSLHTGRSTIRTPQTQTGMGTRVFLLPPPSPCALRAPQAQKQVPSNVLGSSTPTVAEDSGSAKQESLSDKQNAEQDNCTQEKMRSCERDDALLGGHTSIPPVEGSPGRPTADEGKGSSELRDITAIGDAHQAEEEYASSPLPPSSPLPASPFSSPAKHYHHEFDHLTTRNLVLPDSDILLPSASDSDGPRRAANTNWLSDDACAAPWFTDSAASAWLTETEAWLTDTEGGPLLTDSDGTWLSDSDAVFGDMSSLPPSSASNWLSDDADVDTDGELGAMEGQDGEFDAAALERAFSALVDRGGRAGDKDEGGGSGGTHGIRMDAEFWESMQPLLGLNGAGTVPGDGRGSVNKVSQDLQGLLDDLVGS